MQSSLDEKDIKWDEEVAEPTTVSDEDIVTTKKPDDEPMACGQYDERDDELLVTPPPPPPPKETKKRRHDKKDSKTTDKKPRVKKAKTVKTTSPDQLAAKNAKRKASRLEKKATHKEEKDVDTKDKKRKTVIEVPEVDGAVDEVKEDDGVDAAVDNEFDSWFELTNILILDPKIVVDPEQGLSIRIVTRESIVQALGVGRGAVEVPKEAINAKVAEIRRIATETTSFAAPEWLKGSHALTNNVSCAEWILMPDSMRKFDLFKEVCILYVDPILTFV